MFPFYIQTHFQEGAEGGGSTISRSPCTFHEGAAPLWFGAVQTRASQQLLVVLSSDDLADGFLFQNQKDRIY